jgi:hypothetical protein
MDTSNTLVDERTPSTVEKLLEGVAKLDLQQKAEIYKRLRAAMVKDEEAERKANKYRGVVEEGYWGKDAQEYINELRSDDRF